MSNIRAFYNGKIFTSNKANPWASAVVIEGNRIIYVGDDEGAKPYLGKGAEANDLKGKLMTPGLIDGHIHALMATLINAVIAIPWDVDLKTMQGVIKDYIEKHPDLPAYLGMGWLDLAFGPTGPKKEWLDEICPDKPILLFAASGHSGWCNSKALELAGIDRNYRDPNPEAGQRFYRDENGDPTGYVQELTCLNIVLTAYNYVPQSLIYEQAVKLGQLCSSLGLTSLVDCGNYNFFEDIMNDATMKEIEDDACPVRLDACGVIATSGTIQSAYEEASRLHKLYNGEKFRVTFFKIVNDGTADSFSAAMPNKYPNGNFIKPTYSAEELAHYGELCAKEGLDINIHAIGSSTVHAVLEAARILREKGYKDLRIACSHSSYVFPSDIPLFEKYNVTANTTAKWFFEMPEQYIDLIAKISEGKSYPAHSIIAAGGRLSLSSDYPTDPNALNPMLNAEVALTRQQPGNKDALIHEKEDRIAMEDVITAYTINNAYTMRMEDRLGSLEVGKYADMVIFEDDLFAMDPYSIHDAKVSETIMDGITRYKRK